MDNGPGKAKVHGVGEAGFHLCRYPVSLPTPPVGTANAMAVDRERCLEAGMNDHIPKPIDPDQLFGALSRWIGQV